MTWTVRRPRFEVSDSKLYGWRWTLINDGQDVASSHVEHWSKADVLDFVRWLKYHAQEVPIIGTDHLEL